MTGEERLGAIAALVGALAAFALCIWILIKETVTNRGRVKLGTPSERCRPSRSAALREAIPGLNVWGHSHRPARRLQRIPNRPQNGTRLDHRNRSAPNGNANHSTLDAAHIGNDLPACF